MLKYPNNIGLFSMAKRKMTLDEKRDLARNEIMQISLDLFLEKGYDKTTTRDIITQAGILNGSLYNRFRNKEEILISIVREATLEVLSRSMELMKKEHNILEAAIFPGAIQLYISSTSVGIASLIYEVHCKQNAVKVFTEIFHDWYEKFLSEYGYQVQKSHDIDMSLAALIGASGAMVGCYSRGSEIPCKDSIRIYSILVASTFHMPAINIDKVVENVMGILASKDLTFMGRSIAPYSNKPRRETIL